MIKTLLPFFIFLFIGVSLSAQIEYQLFATDNFSYDYESNSSETWIASDGGLVRVNAFSNQVDVYTPANSELQGIEVREVELTDDGKLWLITKFALQSFDGEDWYSVPLELSHWTTISNLRISEQGTIWFLFNKVLHSWSNEELKNYSSFFGEELLGFDLDSDHLIYAYNSDKAYKFDGQVSIELTLPSDDVSNIVDGVITKYEDFIFLSNHTNEENEKTRKLFKYSDNAGIELLRSDDNLHYFTNRNSLGFIKDSRDDIWLQYRQDYPENTLLLKITLSEIEDNTFETRNLDLPGDDGEYILMDIDENNNYWLRKNVQDAGQRIFKANSSTVDSFDLKLANINTRGIGSNKIGEDCDGNILTISGKYVSTFDGNEWTNKCFTEFLPAGTTYQVPTDLAYNPISCELWWSINNTNNEILIVKDGEISFKNIGSKVLQIEFSEDGTSYILTEDGFLITDSYGVEEWIPQESLPFYPSGYNSMELGRDNIVWFLMHENIYKFENGNWELLDSASHPYAELYRNHILVDNSGRLWTYYQDGFAILDEAIWELIPFEVGEFHPYIYYQSSMDKLWLWGDIGLRIFDKFTFESLNVSNSSICSNNVFDIHFATNGDVWLLHDKGISRLVQRYVEQNHTIAGITFYDHNQDGEYDLSEDARLSNQRIFNHHNNEITYTNSSGGYAFGVDDQISSSVEITPDQDWMTVSPSILDYEVENSDLIDLNFALYSDQLVSEMSLDLVGAPSICNGITNFWITIKNEGIETQSGTVSFSFDELYSFESSNQETSLEELTYIEWEFENLRYTESKTFVVSLLTPNEDNFGESFSFIATVSNGDLMIEKDVELIEELFCSYDPNDKLSQSIGESVGQYSLLDDALEYTIRFQNFGNYPARKVVIIDTLDQHLDVNSFEILSHSHDVATTIIEGNIVIFKFEEINLPFEEEDAAGSNGFIKYRIKAKDDTPTETTVDNRASIYFDFNAGILTNTTENILVDELPVSSNHDLVKGDVFTIYPNPSSSEFVIDSEDKTIETALISIFNLHGKLLSVQTANSFPASLKIDTNGMYVVAINQGGELQTFKVVKTED